jgi:hypothetical protein
LNRGGGRGSLVPKQGIAGFVLYCTSILPRIPMGRPELSAGSELLVSASEVVRGRRRSRLERETCDFGCFGCSILDAVRLQEFLHPVDTLLVDLEHDLCSKVKGEYVRSSTI